MQKKERPSKMWKTRLPLLQTICAHYILLSISCYFASDFAFCENSTPQEITIPDNLVVAEADNKLESIQKNHQKNSASTTASSIAFDAFTGKINGNRVRLRLLPSLDSPIIRELSAGELWVITGEVDEFYAVIPGTEIKGYIYRTYVLDGKVEGNNVNLRLKPDMQAPVITQLGQGDKVVGETAKENQKWLEVDLPSDIRFYVAKEYVQRVGNKSFFAQMAKEKASIIRRLDDLKIQVQQEIEKPFHDIQLAPLANQLKALSSTAAHNFPDVAQKINDVISSIQEEYLKLSMIQQTKPSDFHIGKPKEESTSLELHNEPEGPLAPEKTAQTKTSYRSKWSTFSLLQQEQTIIQNAITAEEVKDENEFYDKEIIKSFILKGLIVPYERMVKNRPGDYILLNSTSKVPLAYLYSTRVDLTEYIGNSPIEVRVVERPNHYFALPAYFVLEIKKSSATQDDVAE